MTARCSTPGRVPNSALSDAPRGAAHSVIPSIAPSFHGADNPEQHNQDQYSFTDHDVLARVFWFWTLFLVSLVPLLIAVFMSKFG